METCKQEGKRNRPFPEECMVDEQDPSGQVLWDPEGKQTQALKSSLTAGNQGHLLVNPRKCRRRVSGICVSRKHGVN